MAKSKTKRKDAAEKLIDLSSSIIARGEMLASFLERPSSYVFDTCYNWADKFKFPLFKWLGNAGSAILSVPAVVTKIVTSIVDLLITMIPEVSVAIINRNSKALAYAAEKTLATTMGILLIVLSTTGNVIQCVLYLQDFGRKLTKKEADMMGMIFHNTIALHSIRIIEGRSGILALNKKANTLGNNIYIKRRETPAFIVHECTHVWQYQNCGPRCMAEALYMQFKGEIAYNWLNELKKGKRKWIAFNRESQAEFIEETFKYGTSAEHTGHRAGSFFIAEKAGKESRFISTRDGKEYTKLVFQTLDYIRSQPIAKYRSQS